MSVRYRLRERLLSIGDSFTVEDDEGGRPFRVNGKVARVRDTWVLEDGFGKEVARIRERKVGVRDAIKVLVGPDTATVKKRILGIRRSFGIGVDNGRSLSAQGNVTGHEYTISDSTGVVAQVSKKWFRTRDTYGVEVVDPADSPMILAVTVAIDAFED